MTDKPLNDEELVALLDQGVRQAVGYSDSKLAKERADAVRFYDAELPRPMHGGDSKYVSMDVYDAVESMKAQLLETFTGNAKPVQFAPQGAEDTQLALQATEAANYVIFRQNPGFNVFRDVIHDGLMYRNGVAKVYWKTDKSQRTETFEGMAEDEVDFLFAQDEVVDGEASLDELTGLYTVEVTVEDDKSRVALDAVPPEEFLISPRARSIEEADFVAHRSRWTLSELIAQGYDERLVKKIGGGDSKYALESEEEVIVRFQQVDDNVFDASQADQETLREVEVFEVYRRLDMDASGIAKLWKITYAGTVILDKEEVDEKPFLDFAPLPRPHSYWGTSYVDKVTPTQNARTLLTRSIINHSLITNNPRYQVVKGGLLNPKELMDNRVGGLVNVNRPDAVVPLPQASLNPHVFQTVAMLDEDKEETTGISRLSQGMNKDAISKQNSSDMVGQLISVSQQRQKVIARNFVEDFLRPLYLRVYKLLLENQQGPMIAEIAGSFQEIDPSRWASRQDVTIELAIGYGEADKEAARHMEMYQLFASDPALAPMFTADKRYALLDRIASVRGTKDLSQFLTPPDQVQPPQPDPAQQLQMAQMQQQLELQERQQALAEAKFQHEQQMDAHKAEMERKKFTTDFAMKSDQHDLKETEHQHKARMDEAELAILKSTPDKRGIASP